jgi:hypothetical protein
MEAQLATDATSKQDAFGKVLPVFSEWPRRYELCWVVSTVKRSTVSGLADVVTGPGNF